MLFSKIRRFRCWLLRTHISPPLPGESKGVMIYIKATVMNRGRTDHPNRVSSANAHVKIAFALSVDQKQTDAISHLRLLRQPAFIFRRMSSRY